MSRSMHEYFIERAVRRMKRLISRIEFNEDHLRNYVMISRLTARDTEVRLAMARIALACLEHEPTDGELAHSEGIEPMDYRIEFHGPECKPVIRWKGED